jgi:hypothetical protein
MADSFLAQKLVLFTDSTHAVAACHRPFVIVIDDARCFGNDPAYPAVAQVRDHVNVLSRGAASVAVENDMIIIRQTSGAC